MITPLEESVIDFWCASFALRTDRPLTCGQRIAAYASLLDLTQTAPTGGLRDRAREACLGLGIVARGFSVIDGGQAS